MTINNYFNPLSDHFESTCKEYQNLPIHRKIIAVVSAIVGGILTPFILFTGSFALFQVTVKWLKPGDNSNADSVDDTVRRSPVFYREAPVEVDSTTFTEATIGDFTGEGILIFRNGEKYEGAFVEGEMNGIGSLKFLDGTIFEGIFENNQIKDSLIHEIGKFYFANGDIYTGSVRGGKMHGKGKLQFSGHVYEGLFFEGKKHGKGKINFSTGDSIDGTFQEGRLASGLYRYANNSDYQEYHGQFAANGKFGGWGRLNYNDGTVVRGWWINGTRPDNEAVHTNYPRNVWG